ncbi:uncharacterized protein LOC124920342 [Impatiens glandulifera]|uniref:uncharacterized protein LOC124920342 n=1 Tax=Impatiens glandulifera TaxID=253017 RepID=UPI001FB15D11|nr:uncharacterized protein LOC124920342 [Impatiens glandulifera]
MTLEDFFTLTEMKDGLAVPARVKDLVNVMHREKDSIVKSMGDMTRQWSTVASTIIATEDKDCLELFIQLDGLCFIDRWLNDAQRFSVETSDNFVEESITVLLRALEKLQIGYERSSASGILLTVENLLKHGSSRVQDGAKALFDQWKKNGDTDQVSVEHSGADISLPNGGEEKCDDGSADDTNERKPVMSADDVEKETILEEKEVKEDDTRLELTAVENSSKEESVVVVADSVEKENDSFTPVVFDEVIEERSNVPIPNDCAAADDDKQEMPMEIDSTGKLHAKVGSSVVDDDLQSHSPMQIDDCKSLENGNATIPTEDNGEVDELEEEDSSEENKELTINLNLLKPAIICKVPNSIDEKRSDIELDYSIVDALEVARQVAIDVEREVGDHREPSCSNSSEKKQSIDPSSMKDEEPSSSNSSSISRNSRETLDPKTENSSPLTVSSTEIVDKELEANSSGKGLVGLDLNQEVCSEDIDQPEKPIPTHISQVSASRAAAVSELASSPLQQQPEDGWKGSATTSAFRKVLEGIEKTPPAETNRNFLGFDLNVADEEEEDEDEKTTRPILDLNIISDDSDSVPDQSSSKKKICLDFNLNEDDSHSDQHQSSVAPFQSISLMGTKVEVGKREPITQSSSSSSIKDQVNLPRTGTGVGFFSFGGPLQYPQMGPSSQFSLSPYMVDPTRGGPVLPQSQFFMMGPPPAGGGHYNGAGSSSSSSNHNHHRIFDLNMGTTNEGVNRENVGFRQFLSIGGGGQNNNNRMMEEQQLRGGSLQQQHQHQQQPSSSSSSGYGLGKRKEAEGGGGSGWEGYPYNLKRQQPPWK